MPRSTIAQPAVSIRPWLGMIFVFAIAAIATAFAESGPSKVVLKKTGDESWTLTRNGAPFFVKGVGGSEHLDQAVALGANSIRTWGVGKDTRALMDRAQQQGLTVSFGHWLGHKRHWFNIHDEAAVARQQREVVANTRAYMNHPALLFWGVGNEVETGQENDPKVWQVVNAAARAIKEVDPHHPTMIIIAELGPGDSKVKNIAKYCPDIDIVGLNAYDGAADVVKRFRAHKIGKPCILTEYGPPLYKRDAFGRVEGTSAQKAADYARIYRGSISAHPGFCLGGYSFVWGSKTEMTDTYFGQFLASGERLPQAEIFHQLFGVPSPPNRCPVVSPLQLEPASRVAEVGSPIRLRLPAKDPDGDPLRYRWELKEVLRDVVGGDALRAKPNLAAAITHTAPDSAEVSIQTDKAGTYRVYGYVFDGKGQAATATTLVAFKKKTTMQPAKRLDLPVVLYRENRHEAPYVPSGMMGDRRGEVRMDYKHADRPHSGKTCLRVTVPAHAWSGLSWQHPANDWGEKPGGFDLRGAKRLRFWVRGKAGGEVITFAIGGVPATARYPDSLKKEHKVRLTTEWQQVNIDLTGSDLSRVKTPFHWSLSAGAGGAEFYLDDVVIE